MAWMNDADFADKVAICCHDHYHKKLSKKGKPQPSKEWTMLSCIVLTIDRPADNSYDLKVVALGTGSKCIGQSKMSAKGDVINDSHAEILARRAFLRYIYKEIQTIQSGEESIFLAERGEKYCLREGIAIHLYVSHTPCGDASIFPKVESDENDGHIIDDSRPKCKRIEEANSDEPQCKKQKTCENGIDDSRVSSAESEKAAVADVHRTGAKCVPGGEQDARSSGSGYHVVSCLRTKPGRGERSLSLSCSDKAARWATLGIQGAMSMLLLSEPLYVSSVTVAGGCAYSPSALHRALVARLSGLRDLPAPYRVTAPRISQAGATFEHSRRAVTAAARGCEVTPCAAGIIWYCGQPQQEVTVNGLRLGTTAKNRHKPVARCCVCKYELFKEFMATYSRQMERLGLKNSLEKKSYEECKLLSCEYQAAWEKLRTVFSTWIRSPRHLISNLYIE